MGFGSSWHRSSFKTTFDFVVCLRKPKDVVSDSDKKGLVYEIPCRDCDAVYIRETGRSLKTRKQEHMEAVKGHYANMSQIVTTS